LVGRERLVEANAKIIAAESVSAVVGPALAAGLIGLVGAPLAVTATATGFLLSFALLALIARDDAPEAGERPPWWREAKAGLRFVWHTPMLRGMALVGAVWVMYFDGFRTLYVLFSTRELGFSASDIAIANTVGAVGALAGARAARLVEHRRGPRSGLIAGYLLSAIGISLYPASAAFSLWGLPTLVGASLALFWLDFGATLYVVNYLSLRQKITPDPLLGRMTTTMRFMTVAAAPLGALGAGQGGEILGMTATLFVIGAVGLALALAAARWLPQPPSLETERRFA
jgi:hypothetical protein